jgi:small subunit ribosomal protein S15
MSSQQIVEEMVKEFGLKSGDTGSALVQVALLTDRINKLSPHFERFQKDHSSKRGMMKLIGKRKSLLKYLSDVSPSAYQQLLGKLGLRK